MENRNAVQWKFCKSFDLEKWKSAWKISMKSLFEKFKNLLSAQMGVYNNLIGSLLEKSFALRIEKIIRGRFEVFPA